MRWLVDSGVALRLAHASDPQYSACRRAVTRLKRAGDELVVVPQTLAEFWAVSTRPATARGGYGMPVAETAAKLRLIERRFPLLVDPPDTYRRWRRAVTRHGVQGAATHDARLVAAMQAHGLTNILTLNASDFARYPGITAVAPAAV